MQIICNFSGTNFSTVIFVSESLRLQEYETNKVKASSIFQKLIAANRDEMTG